MKSHEGKDAKNRAALASMLLFLLLSATAQAQERRAEPATVTATTKTDVALIASTNTPVRTFQVKPSQTKVLVMPAAEHSSKRPKAIDPATKKRALEDIGGGGGGGVPTVDGIKTAPEIKLEHIILSPKRPFHNKRGYLRTMLAFTADPESGYNFNKNYPGMAAIYLNVEAGRSYLLDFAVSSWGSGTYKIKSESGDQSFDDPGGKTEHILVGLNAQSSGWTTLQFERQGTGYYLYTIEVTRAN